MCRLPLTHSLLPAKPPGPPRSAQSAADAPVLGSDVPILHFIGNRTPLLVPRGPATSVFSPSSVVQSAALGPEQLAANKISSSASYKSIVIPPRRLVRHAGSPVFLHHSGLCSWAPSPLGGHGAVSDGNKRRRCEMAARSDGYLLLYVRSLPMRTVLRVGKANDCYSTPSVNFYQCSYGRYAELKIIRQGKFYLVDLSRFHWLNVLGFSR